MPDEEVEATDYLPLFAGPELVRRSGALTEYPIDLLLGNLPPEEEE